MNPSKEELLEIFREKREQYICSLEYRKVIDLWNRSLLPKLIKAHLYLQKIYQERNLELIIDPESVNSVTGLTISNPTYEIYHPLFSQYEGRITLDRNDIRILRTLDPPGLTHRLIFRYRSVEDGGLIKLGVINHNQTMNKSFTVTFDKFIEYFGIEEGNK